MVHLKRFPHLRAERHTPFTLPRHMEKRIFAFIVMLASHQSLYPAAAPDRQQWKCHFLPISAGVKPAAQLMQPAIKCQ